MASSGPGASLKIGNEASGLSMNAHAREPASGRLVPLLQQRDGRVLTYMNDYLSTRTHWHIFDTETRTGGLSRILPHQAARR